MCFQSEVLEYFYLGQAVMALHSVPSVIKINRIAVTKYISPMAPDLWDPCIFAHVKRVDYSHN